MYFSARNLQCQIILFYFLFISVQSSSFFSWVWSKTVDYNVNDNGDELSIISIPYETTIEDEKFLQEASKLTDIQLSSPLEICHHKIVIKLKGSCMSMTEEEFGKFSVGLLNCQSAIEGRKIYPCTDEMSLKQCTIDMDSDTWNAYHLMSNRARAICYSVRNVQFRALSELAINKLVQNARAQIESLSSLKKGHNNLKDTTEKVLSIIEEKNQILMAEHEYLKKAQLNAYRYIQENLRDLYNERSLIRGGRAQLTEMFSDMGKKIEQSDRHFTKQFLEIQRSHQTLLKSLAMFQQQSLKNLAKINETIHSIKNASNTIYEEVQEIMDWFSQYLGNSAEQLIKYVYISFHVIYLFGVMIIAAFLNVSFFVRLLIITLVPLNMMIIIKNGMEAELDFSSITFLLFLSAILYYMVNYLCHYIVFIIEKMQSKRVARGDEPTSRFLLFRIIKNVLSLANSLKVVVFSVVTNCIWRERDREDVDEYPSLISEDNDENRFVNLANTSGDEEYTEHVGCRLRAKSAKNNCSLITSKSSRSTTSPELCVAKTKFGNKCRSHVRPGQQFCDRHNARN